MPAEQILLTILAIMVISQLFDWGLSWLNMRAHTDDVPHELRDEIDAEKYREGVAYHATNFRFGLIRSGMSALIIIPLIALGGLGWLDDQLREITAQPILLALLFFGIVFILSDLLSTPFTWYKTFVIEEKYGFNKMTGRTFWVDKLKGYILTLIVGGGILSFLFWLIGELGSSFWWWFWIFMTLFSVVTNLFYTSWILPLFNKLSPMEEGELRTAIEDYSHSVNFPIANIMVIDGSKRSSKANAFFSGMGKRKKVVLYDTLIDQQSTEELVAVMAHEVGHYKKRHIYQGLVLSLIQTGVILFILSRFLFSPELSEALGASETAVHLNLIAFGLLFSPISTVLGILMNIFSRKNEFEADQYAAETYSGKPLESALLSLHTENLSNATPHPAYVFVTYSHPPLLERLRALRALRN